MSEGTEGRHSRHSRYGRTWWIYKKKKQSTQYMSRRGQGIIIKGLAADMEERQAKAG